MLTKSDRRFIAKVVGLAIGTIIVCFMPTCNHASNVAALSKALEKTAEED